MNFFKAFRFALLILRIEKMKKETEIALQERFLGTSYGGDGVLPVQNNSKRPEYLSHLTKDQIRSQIKSPCLKCGSDAKTSALNRETGRIMITCLKCQDWMDFK